MRSTRTAAAVLVVMALMATACGARLSDEQRAAVLSGSGGAADGATDGDFGGGFGDDVGLGDPLDTGGTTDGGDLGDPSGGDASTGGDTGSGSGGGTTDGGGSTSGGGATSSGSGGGAAVSCAADNGGATDVGVTAREVKLGNVSLLSGAIQGFANTAVGATKAFINFQNSQQGICGRALNLDVSDDRFDSGVNRSEHDRLSKQVFAFVGSLSVVDDGGVSVLKGTNIPDVTLALSDDKLALANNFAPTPLDLVKKSNNAVGYSRWIKANEGVTQYAIIWPGQATARNRAFDYRNDFERAGLTKAYEAEVGVTETNYTPHASAICNANPDKTVLVTTLEVNGMARLAKALKQQGCLPKFAHYGAQAYGNQFIELAGDAAEGTRLLIYFDIVEGTTNPMTRSFAEWFGRTNPGLTIDFFAIQSWISGHMLATAMRAAGSELTRDRVIAELNKLVDYTAEGMTAPITPGQKKGPACFLIARVSGGAWERERPAKGFICP